MGSPLINDAIVSKAAVNVKPKMQNKPKNFWQAFCPGKFAGTNH